jgi:hypothetical protein
MMNKIRIVSVVGVLALLLAPLVQPGLAQEPAPQGTPLAGAITYQGQLNRGGSPVNSTCNLRFSLYDAAAGGLQVGSTLTRSGVTLANGLFTVADLDFGSDAFGGEARWLEVAVQCTGDASYTTLGPRQALTAPPYAFHWGGTWRGTGTGLTLSGGMAGLAGIGTLVGVSGTSPASDGIGVLGSASSTSGVGVFGSATATTGVTYGVRGVSASLVTDSAGVYGYSTALAGTTYGVFGQSDSVTDGRGVYGYSPVGTGVYGKSDSGRGVEGYTSTGTYGVYGRSNATTARAVYGFAFASSGTTYGVMGESLSTTSSAAAVYGYARPSTAGTGVYGYASAPTGVSYGVKGKSDSTSGRGVYGEAFASTGVTYGVYGSSASSQDGASGVYGLASGGGKTYGVQALNSSTTTGAAGVYSYLSGTSGSTYGVHSKVMSPNAWAVYGEGPASGVQGKVSHSYGIGVYGRNEATTGNAEGVLGVTYSSTGRGVSGKAWSAGGTGVYGEAAAGGTGVYGEAATSTSNYGVYSYGNTGATGTKAAVVQTQDYGWRELYAVESPQVLFEDVGSAQLLNGLAVVDIDPVFAQTVNLAQAYQVFVTPLGDCGLYVAEKTGTSFTVRALDGRECSIGFDYRIIATRLGYETSRLAPAQDPALLVRPESWEAQP